MECGISDQCSWRNWVREKAQITFINVLQTHPIPTLLHPLPIFTLQGKSLKLLKKGWHRIWSRWSQMLSEAFLAGTDRSLAPWVQERSISSRLCAAELGSLSWQALWVPGLFAGDSSDGDLKRERCLWEVQWKERWVYDQASTDSTHDTNKLRDKPKSASDTLLPSFSSSDTGDHNHQCPSDSLRCYKFQI